MLHTVNSWHHTWEIYYQFKYVLSKSKIIYQYATCNTFWWMKNWVKRQVLKNFGLFLVSGNLAEWQKTSKARYSNQDCVKIHYVLMKKRELFEFCIFLTFICGLICMHSSNRGQTLVRNSQSISQIFIITFSNPWLLTEVT